MNLIYLIYVLLAYTVASNAQTTTTASIDTTTPANISWYAPLRDSIVNLTDGVAYLVFFTPSPRITFEAIDLYQDCDGVQGTLVMHLGAVNVSVGNFKVNIYSSLSATTLYCFEMSDSLFWYNSPPFYVLTAAALPSAVTVTSTAIIETVASQIQSSTFTQSATTSSATAGSTIVGSTSPSQPSGLSGGTIGGIAAGGAILLIGAFAFGWCFRRSKTSNNSAPPLTSPYQDQQMGQATPYPAYPASNPRDTIYSQNYQLSNNIAPVQNFAPAQQKSQGGLYAQPLSPAELENIYSRPPVATYPQQSHVYNNAAPPPFHTVLKPFDPELEQTPQFDLPSTPLTGYIQVPQTPEQRQRVPDANV